VVAAVVVGGVAIFGGSGHGLRRRARRAAAGDIGSALVILKVNPFWEQAIDGALLLVAIGLDRLLALRVAAACARGAARTVPD
jgi:rhamnose transport system permease protein